MGKDGYPIGATNTAFDIVEFLGEEGTAGVTEIADAIGRSKSAVYNQLKTLEHRGFVVQSGREYRIGYRFLTLGVHAKHQSALLRIARRYIDDLASTTNQTVSLLIQQQAFAVYLYQSGVAGDERPPVQEGDFEHLWSFPGGKMFLTYLSEDDRAELLSQDEEQSSTDVAADSTIETMGDRRIASGNRGREQQWQTIAAPVLTMDDAPVGLVEVMGTEDALSGRTSEVEIPGLVLNTVKSIEKELLQEGATTTAD